MNAQRILLYLGKCRHICATMYFFKKTVCTLHLCEVQVMSEVLCEVQASYRYTVSANNVKLDVTL